MHSVRADILLWRTAEVRSFSFPGDCVRSAFCCLSTLWEAAFYFSWSLRQEDPSFYDCPPGCSCFGECDCLSEDEIPRGFEKSSVVFYEESDEKFCVAEILKAMMGVKRTAKKLVQVLVTILTCGLVFLSRQKSNTMSSGCLLYNSNTTTETTPFEVEFQFHSSTNKPLRKSKSPFSAYWQNSKAANVPLHAAELVLLSVLAKNHIVVACCHLLMASRASSFPSAGGSEPDRAVGPMTLHVALFGSPNKGYCAMINIGMQSYQQVCVLIDTGSSNLAVAAAPQQNQANYFHTDLADHSFQKLGTEVAVQYSVGEWSGELARDKISIVSSGNTTDHLDVEFALIENSVDFFVNGAQWGGILGMAYSSLAKPDSSVTTFWDALRNYYMMEDVFAMKMCPPLNPSSFSVLHEQGGELVLGGYEGLHSGPIFYTPIVQEDFYNVLITSINIGGDLPVSISCSEFNKRETIIDSATTDIYLAEKAFDAVHTTLLIYFKESPNFQIPDTFWTGSSKLAWPSDDLQFIYTGFPTIYVGFASDKNESQEFLLGITPQIYLRQVEGSVGERQSSFCVPQCTFFVFGIKSKEGGSVIGGNAMLGFATVFDRESRRIGFASSTCQYQDNSDGSVPHIVGPYYREARDCSCQTCTSPHWWTYVSLSCVFITVFCIAIILISLKLKKNLKCIKVFVLMQSCCCRHRKYKSLQHSTRLEGSNSEDHSSSPHLNCSTQRKRPFRRISFTIIIKKLRHILGRENRRYCFPVTADEESINLLATNQMDEYSQPIEESSADGNIVIAFDNQTFFKGTCKLSGNANTITLQCKGSVGGGDLHASKQAPVEDEVSFHSDFGSPEGDRFADSPVFDRSVCEASSSGNVESNEETSEHADLSTVQEVTTRDSYSQQQAVQEIIEPRDESTLHQPVQSLQVYERPQAAQCDSNDCLQKNTGQVLSECNLHWQDSEVSDKTSEILPKLDVTVTCDVWISTSQEILASEANNLKKAVIYMRVSESEHTECSADISDTCISPIAADNTDIMLEATKHTEVREAINADQTEESSSLKPDILKGYPKLALAEAPRIILEETNNKEEPSDENVPTPHISPTASISPQEFLLDVEIETPFKENAEHVSPDRKRAKFNGNKNEQILKNKQRPLHNMNRNDIRIKKHKKCPKYCDSKTEETCHNDEEEYNQNFNNNQSSK